MLWRWFCAIDWSLPDDQHHQYSFGGRMDICSKLERIFSGFCTKLQLISFQLILSSLLPNSQLFILAGFILITMNFIYASTDDKRTIFRFCDPIQNRNYDKSTAINWKLFSTKWTTLNWREKINWEIVRHGFYVFGIEMVRRRRCKPMLASNLIEATLPGLHHCPRRKQCNNFQTNYLHQWATLMRPACTRIERKQTVLQFGHPPRIHQSSTNKWWKWKRVEDEKRREINLKIAHLFKVK